MYGLCFRYCLSFVLQQALIELPHNGLVLNFIVEEGHPNEGAPATIVSQLKRKRIREVSEFLGAAVPGEKKRVPGLQAADALATGAWRGEARDPQFTDIPQDASVSELRRIADEKIPIFRCHADERELGQFKDGYFAHIEHRREFGRKKHWKPE
jgi:hypothetical protein